MSGLPPLLPDKSPTDTEFFRKVRDLVNSVAKRTSNYGTTAERPKNPSVGWVFYDTTLGKPVWHNGVVWKDATGTTV